MLQLAVACAHLSRETVAVRYRALGALCAILGLTVPREMGHQDYEHCQRVR